MFKYNLMCLISLQNVTSCLHLNLPYEYGLDGSVIFQISKKPLSLSIYLEQVEHNWCIICFDIMLSVLHQHCTTVVLR